MPTSIARYTHDAIAAELRAAALRFGEGLRRWRVAQGWSQNTPQQWGRAAGFAHVFNSQWSQLETGKLQGPKPLVFRALGAMNLLLHARHYGTIRDVKLRQQVQAAKPICHPDGKPWTGVDFLRAFWGDLDFPGVREQLPPITDDQAAEFSANLRRALKAEAKRRSLAIGVAAGDLLAAAPEDHRDRLEDVLFGDDWSGAELMDLRDESGELLPEAWVKGWRGS